MKPKTRIMLLTNRLIPQFIKHFNQQVIWKNYNNVYDVVLFLELLHIDKSIFVVVQNSLQLVAVVLRKLCELLSRLKDV